MSRTFIPRATLAVVLVLFCVTCKPTQKVDAAPTILIEAYQYYAGTAYGALRSSVSGALTLDYLFDPSGVFEFPVFVPLVVREKRTPQKHPRDVFALLESRWGRTWSAPRKEDFRRLLAKETIHAGGVVPACNWLVRVSKSDSGTQYWYGDPDFRTVYLSPTVPDSNRERLLQEYPEWGHTLQLLIASLNETPDTQSECQMEYYGKVSKVMATSKAAIKPCEAMLRLDQDRICGVDRDTIERMMESCRALRADWIKLGSPRSRGFDEAPLPVIDCWLHQKAQGK